jgi:hypothetical protein
MTLPPPVPLEEVAGDVLVLFHFQDVPIPRHALGKVDWVLSGAVARLAVDGKFSGAVGTAALFHPAGKFPVAKILVVGLGPSSSLDVETLHVAARHLDRLLDDLRAQDVRIVLPEVPHVPSHEMTEAFAAALCRPRGHGAPTAVTFVTVHHARSG